MTSLPTPILRLTDIGRRYNVGTEVETEVLHGISLALQQAEFVALKGPSGSGRSTLRNIIGVLERPSSGALDIAGQSTQSLDDAGLTNLRGAAIGFVSQFHPPAAGLHGAGKRAATPGGQHRPRRLIWRW